MTIYECLGIDRILIDMEIPLEVLLNNIADNLRTEAEHIFTNIERIAIKCSINRAEHYLQVIEIVLNSPQDIQRISYIIQKTIKYRVLFIFAYDERYLLLWRNFYLTESTENVYTEHTTHCTSWIYGECLQEDVVCFLNIEIIENDYDENYNYHSSLKESVDDNGDWVYFRDILNNVILLNNCLIESDVVCVRYVIDWMQYHKKVQSRIGYQELIKIACQQEIYSIIENHLLFETYNLQLIIMELEKSYYMRDMRYTGRRPMVYFEQIPYPATFADELDLIGNISFIVNKSEDELIQLEDYYGEDEYPLYPNRGGKFLVTETFGCIRLVDKQRKVEEAHLAEEKHRAEEQLIRKELCKAEEQRILEQLRLAEEQRKAEETRLAEEKRRAEEQRIREELCKAEEQRILKQLRLAEEQRKAEETRLAEEKRRAEEQCIREELRQAEEQRILEQLRLAEEQRKAEETRLAEEKRLAEEQRIREELRRVTEKQLLEQLCRILKKRIAEVTCLAEERRKAEEVRLAEEQRKAEEIARIRIENERKDKIYDIAVHLSESRELSVLSEAIALLRYIDSWRDSEEQILRLEEKIVFLKMEIRRSQYRRDGVCQYCGGKFKGIFRRICMRCGKPKDYK